MLRLECPPDPVFTAILHAALEETRDWITNVLEDAGDEWWSAQYPLIAARFTPQLTLEVIDRLLVASRDTTVYELTEYHWLLLYESLKVFCNIHNDNARDHPDDVFPVGPYRIGQIDFDELLDTYFEDLDILTEPEVLERLGPEGRREMHMRDEIFGVAHGLPPHPDEVRLPHRPPRPWDESDWEEARKAWPSTLPVYPPELEPDKEQEKKG
jgi:hypothetical protein